MIPDPDQLEAVAGHEPGRWERRPDETDKSYRVFAVYRDLGVLRSLRKAAASFYSDSNDPADATHAQLNQCKTWSAANDWPARAQAWDDYLDEIARAEQVEQVKEMNRVHATIGRNMLGRVQAALRDLVDDQTATLTPSELARLADVGVKIERLARGEATQRVEAAVEQGDHEAAKARALEMIDELEAARRRKTGT